MPRVTLFDYVVGEIKLKSVVRPKQKSSTLRILSVRSNAVGVEQTCNPWVSYSRPVLGFWDFLH